MSIVSGTVGAVLSADAQGDANKTNRQNAVDQNTLNRDQFYESRGKGGYSVLPYYMKTASGGSAEEALGKDLFGAYQAIGRQYGETPEAQVQHFKDISARYTPMADAASKIGEGIFNGDVGAKMEANAAPVFAARKAFSRQSSIDALNKTLGEIEAAQAGKGYTGDSMGSRLLKFQAHKDAAQGAASAELQNQTELQAIRNRAGIDLPLQYMNLPQMLAQQSLAMDTLPNDMFLDNLNKRLQPLTFTRIGAGQPFQYQPLPTVNPTAGWAQLMAQGGAATGNMAANYLQKQQQQKQLQAMMEKYYGTGAAGSGYGGQGVTPGMESSGAAALGGSAAGSALTDEEIAAFLG